MNAVASSAATIAGYPNTGRRVKVVTICETIPRPGMKMM